MLVLSRRENEGVLFPELGISVEVQKLTRARAAIGIVAPRQYLVIRSELQLSDGVQVHPDLQESIGRQIDAAVDRLLAAQAELASGRVNRAMNELSRAIIDLDRLREQSARFDQTDSWSMPEGVAETAAPYVDALSAEHAARRNPTAGVSSARVLFFDAAAGPLDDQLENIDCDLREINDSAAAIDEVSRYERPDFVLMLPEEPTLSGIASRMNRCGMHRDFPVEVAVGSIDTAD